MKIAAFVLVTLFILFGIVLAEAVQENLREVAMYSFYGMLSSGFFATMFLGKTTNVDLS